MGKVAWGFTCSIDGFVAGPGHDMPQDPVIAGRSGRGRPTVATFVAIGSRTPCRAVPTNHAEGRSPHLPTSPAERIAVDERVYSGLPSIHDRNDDDPDQSSHP